MHALSSVGRAIGVGVVGAVLTLAVAARAADPPEEKKPAKPVPLEGGGARDRPSGVWLGGPVAVWSTGPTGPTRVSEYWLGVVAQGPLPESLRAHLKLPANEGLLVMEVAPDSPAAAAKLQRFDVLLKAGDRALGKVEDLMDALDAGKGQKVSLEIIREGQPRKVEVTPAKRPAHARFRPREWPADLFPGGAGPWEPLKDWIERAEPGSPGGPLRFRLLRPGVLLPPGTPAEPMPGDMTINIIKRGNEPAKVVVTQGDKKWETTDDHLDKLPAEVRPHVERLLDRPLTLDRIPGGGSMMVFPRDLGPRARQELEKRMAEAREEFGRIEQGSRKLADEVRKKDAELAGKLKELVAALAQQREKSSPGVGTSRGPQPRPADLQSQIDELRREIKRAEEKRNQDFESMRRLTDRMQDLARELEGMPQKTAPSGAEKPSQDGAKKP